MKIDWYGEFRIESNIQSDGAIVIRANKDGLITLAKQMLAMAEDSFLAGVHIHYDESSSLEDGSTEIILEKI